MSLYISSYNPSFKGENTKKNDDYQQKSLSISPQLSRDKVEISSKKEDKSSKGGMSKTSKFCLYYALSTLVTSAAAVAYMVGRNPAKAAKVLKGNSEMETAYKKAQDLIKKMENEGKFKNGYDEVLNVFKEPKYKANIYEHLEQVSNILEKDGNAPKNVKKSIETITKNLKMHYEEIEKNLESGKEITENMSKKFVEDNKTDFKNISKYIQNKRTQNPVDFSLANLEGYFSDIFLESSLGINPSIKACPEGILPKDGVFYHGTRKNKNIYEKGFSPYSSRQVETSARELGAGVYVTPDVNVAAGFSSLGGTIIPVKLNGGKVALVTENSHKALLDKLYDYLGKSINKESFESLSNVDKNAFMESFIQKVFKDAGYDAAYVPRGIKYTGLVDLTPDINEVIGRNQSQLVVFTPENLEIIPRTLKERFYDIKPKINAFVAQIKYQMAHPYGF